MVIVEEMKAKPFVGANLQMVGPSVLTFLGDSYSQAFRLG